MTDPYRVSRYAHSRLYPWQWRCLHTERVGVHPNHVQCPQGGVARSEDEANARAAEHALTHDAAQQDDGRPCGHRPDYCWGCPGGCEYCRCHAAGARQDEGEG